MVSRTIVPRTTISQFASRSLVTADVKSVSVGACAVRATICKPSACASASAPANTSRPKSESWYIAQIALRTFCCTKYCTPERISS